MNEDLADAGRFIFGLKAFRDIDGEMLYEKEIVNENIPIEFVIMQLKVFLKELKEDYYNKFSKKNNN